MMSDLSHHQIESVQLLFLGYVNLALETGCFSEHINILGAFTKSQHVIAMSSITG